jgi:hypothetical protein
MASLMFRCFVFLLPATFAGASNGFLHPSPEQTLTPELESAVLAAIEEALGEKHRQATEVRLAPLVEMLAPTLKALPKNEHGNFGEKAARYALHRLFVQRHAWFVKGIELGRDGSDATPTAILKNAVPEQVHSLFETKFGSHGLSAHDVAVIAATFESLAHQESMERLRLAYMLKGITPGAPNLTVGVVNELLDVYMAIYVTGLNKTQLANKRDAARLVIRLGEKSYPGFAELRAFVRQMRDESTSNRSILSSVDVSHVVTRFGDKYGRWQHYECEDLKRKLLDIEDDGTGRVSLSKFYNGALNEGHWQFSESPEFLRSMGALDESSPTNPRVIITNYILAPSNCVASSKYYSVCCLDECEDLVDHLEREIQAPAATPARIAELVAAMPSSTARGNHTIAPHLIGRLDEIAAANGGMVLLHGRMFAQWMHHVYPRECPYPHLSGTTTALRTSEFEKQTGLKPGASNEDMQQCIADATGVEGSTEVVWSTEDELYVERAAFPEEEGNIWSCIARFVALFSVVLSMGCFLSGLGHTVGSKADDHAFSKMYV